MNSLKICIICSEHENLIRYKSNGTCSKKLFICSDCNITSHRTCVKCDIFKEANEFRHTKYGRNKISVEKTCKKCIDKYTYEKRKLNPILLKKSLEANKKYRTNNPDTIRQINKNYRKNHPERIKIYTKNWKIKNREKYLNYARNYNWKHNYGKYNKIAKLNYELYQELKLKQGEIK
jgi:hypothetical protein